MSSTLKRPGNQTNKTNKRSVATSLAMVLLVAAGAGVVARYHSGQGKIRSTQVNMPTDGSMHIDGGNHPQGPFEMRLGAAMSTPTGFWPTVFLTVHYPDNAPSSGSLAKLHAELRATSGSMRPGPELREGTEKVISRYLTATVRPLGMDGTPTGPASHFIFNSFFGPDAPLAGVIPTSYSAQTRHLAFDIVENAHPANKGHWVVSGLMPSVQYIRRLTPTNASAQLGPIRLEGQAFELPDTHSAELQRQRRKYLDEVHMESGLPAIECILRATAKNTPAEQWHVVVDRIVPQYFVPTPRMRENTMDPVSILGFARMYPLVSENTAAGLPTCSFYCYPGYPGQQQLIEVGGRVVRQRTSYGMLVFHDLDLIYNPITRVYDGIWRTAQKQSMAGIVIYAMNLISKKTGKPAPDVDRDTAMIRFAYRYPAELDDAAAVQPENLPSAELVDPLNPVPPPTSMLRFRAPVYSEQTDMQGGRFDNWFSVYIPGREPAPSLANHYYFSPGVRQLIRQRCRGALLRISVPKKYLTTHSPIHLKDVQIQIVTRSPSERYPFTLTMPVIQGGESDWASILKTNSTTIVDNRTNPSTEGG